MSRLREAFDERYRAQRGFEGGTDPRISDGEIASFALRKAGQRLRGLLRRLPRSYVGPRVTLQGRRRLQLGAGTALAGSAGVLRCSCSGALLADQLTGLLAGELAAVMYQEAA